MDYTTPNGDGLFDVLGRLIGAMRQVMQCAAEHGPSAIDAALDQAARDTAANLPMQEALAGLPQTARSWIDQSGSTLAALAEAVRRYLRGAVLRDAPQPEDSNTRAIDYLIQQMQRDGAYVDACQVSATVQAAANNSSTDLLVAATVRDGQGRMVQHALPEAIQIAAQNDGSLRLFTALRTERLDPRWPAGSGLNVSLAIESPARSLLINGDFERAAQPHRPDSWLLLDGRPGTDYLLTAPEIQRIIISGNPSDGGYYLRYTSPLGPTYVTPRLPYDATADQVQQALRNAAEELSQVTVTSTGTSPNFTHVITFAGTAGNLANVQVENQTDTGIFNVSQVQAGDPDAYRGQTLKVLGSGAANRRLMQPIRALEPDTIYALAWRHKLVSPTTAGTLTVALLDGYQGQVTVDRSGQQNQQVFDMSAGSVPTQWTGQVMFVRLRPGYSDPLYLSFNVQNLPAGRTWCLDDVVLVPVRPLYAGGPAIATIAGRQMPLPGDAWQIAVNNDRAGAWQEWMARIFDLADRELYLPTSGTLHIPDQLIT